MWRFATSSDPLLQIALLTGLAVTALAMLLLVTVFALRLALILSHRRDRRFVAMWRAVMSQATEALPDAIPHLARADRYRFLKLWNHFHESLRGEAKLGLNALARRCGLDAVALRLLARGSLRQRLIAATTLGHLREERAIPTLLALVDHRHPMLSLIAARALLQIDCATFLPQLIRRFTHRDDWPQARIAVILREQDTAVITSPLLEAIDHTDVAHLPRLLHLLESLPSSATQPAIRTLLANAEDPAVIAACLRVLQDPRGLADVRRLCRHPEAYVRVQAVKALGRLGSAEDEPLFLELISDPNWWVRYRAAQAFAGLPFVGEDSLKALRDRLEDRFSADMLTHVLAERGQR